jgi:predicted O-methyltransferase YrrM
MTENIADGKTVAALLAPRLELPPFDGWAIAEDFAVIIVSHILRYQPKVVVETGSGLSTLIIAHALEKAGCGRLISIEHDNKYYKESAARLSEYGLDHRVQLLQCPLAPCAVANEQPWYQVPLGAIDAPIDFLIIDGPPGYICANARYPAIPVLWENLGDNAVIMLDDANRNDEMESIRKWLLEFKQLSCEYVVSRKGTAILRKRPPSPSTSG